MSEQKLTFTIASAPVPSVADSAEIKTAALWLKIEEGYRQYTYKDTVGVDTIGYGLALHTGLSKEEAYAQMLMRVAGVSTADAVKFIGKETYRKLSTKRRAVLIDMAYNLGLTRLKKFHKFRAAIKVGNYEAAAREMVQSKWKRQVGERATNLSNRMRQG